MKALLCRCVGIAAIAVLGSTGPLARAQSAAAMQETLDQQRAERAAKQSASQPAKAAAVAAANGPAKSASTSFTVTFPAERSAAALDGRLILLLSPDLSREPRSHVDPDEPLSAPYMFGVNVEGLAAGQPVVLDDKAFGWPAASLSQVPGGNYLAQVVLNRYETFNLADGRVLKLAPERGEGQQWALKPGNLYSAPIALHIDPAHPVRTALTLDKEIGPIQPPTESEYIRHIKVRSELLSKFWGRDVYLTAHVLVPKDFDRHPEAHYPLMVFHGHFPEDISEFRTIPPDADLKPDYSQRFHLAGYNRIEQQEAYAFFEKWISADFPRFLVVEIQHANPYYDDSYAVNSANLGPYGDAINKELLPEIERRLRGLGAGWARFTYGGSTGGWEALATQVFYPDMYNGAFAACPDPIDFRAFEVVNIYQDANAYTLQGEALKVERPAIRNYLGEVSETQRDANYMELVAGDRSRSGGQYDIWTAVYSPVGKDGYPQPLFDKVSGVIDKQVASYWRDNYDLSHIIERDWARLAPKLQGKIHIYVGSADTYYLNDAVYFTQERLQGLQPPYKGEVAYGDRAEHCWNGDPKLPNAYSRLHYNVQYLPIILQRIKESAPPGADLKSWRY
jgi:hypothetical protein